jgi:hypothetical protein
MNRNILQEYASETELNWDCILAVKPLCYTVRKREEKYRG